MNKKIRQQLDIVLTQIEELNEKLSSLQDDLQSIYDDEVAKLENIEESFGGTVRYQIMEEQTDALSEACEQLNDANDSLGEVIVLVKSVI